MFWVLRRIEDGQAQLLPGLGDLEDEVAAASHQLDQLLVEGADLTPKPFEAGLRLADAEAFVEQRPADELGCLYYAPSRQRFEAPAPEADLSAQGLVIHFGRPGGVLPLPADA